MVKSYTYWTEEMVDFVRKNYNKLTHKEIAIELGTNAYSVSNMCRRRKIRKDGHTILRDKYKKGFFFGSNKGKKLPYLRKRNLENNPMNDPLVVEKARETIRILHKEGKIKVWNDGLSGEEYLKHYKDGEPWLMTAQRDKEVKRKFIEKNLKTKRENNSIPKGDKHFMYGKTKYNYEPARIASERMRAGGALKARKANNFRPNKPEGILIELIRENNFSFNYVGDGKIWLKGENYSFNPDFLSEDPKHIIEMFGNYWHNLPEIKIKDEERLRTYKSYGYKTLVIWDYELKNPDNVIDKIRGFARECT